MAKKKQNLEDTSAKADLQDFVEKFANDNQESISSEEPKEEEKKEEKEETKRPQFKKSDKSITLPGSREAIDNSNLTEKVKQFLIDKEICKDSDFKKQN